MRTIATAVKARGGRALIVGGWVRDRLLGRPSKDVDLEVFGIPADELRDVLGGSAASTPSARASPCLQGRRHRRGAAAPRVEDRPRPPRRSTVDGRSATCRPGSGAPPRLHRQRDRLDPLDRRVPRSVRRARDLERRHPQSRRRTTFGEDSLRVLRALQFAARFEFTLEPDTRELCRTIPLDDLPAERIWGEIEKLLLQAARPSIGFDLALDLGVVDRLFPGAEGARRLSAGAGMASRGGRLDPHADGRRPGAAADRRSRSSAEGDRHAGRRVPRPRQTADDRVPRRADPIDRSRAGWRRSRRRRCSIGSTSTPSAASTSARRCSASSRTT